MLEKGEKSRVDRTAHGAFVDKKNGDGATALHDAAKRGNVDLIKALIGHGASATIRAEKGYG